MSLNGAIKGMFASLLLACAGVLLVGCHTVEGAGRDVQAIGGGVEETAEQTRPYGEQHPRDRR